MNISSSTKQICLEDTYLFETEATFLGIQENENRPAVILDHSIFYPQGGGQPADRGKIESANGTFIVQDVRLDADGVVWHFGEFEKGNFQEGETVKLSIDKERRVQNAKLHSAGHLIDCAMHELGVDNIKPVKGFHFPDGPYVEYEGTLKNPAELVPKLEEKVNELISKNIQIEKRDLSPEEAKQEGIDAPPGKSARVINFAGFSGFGCGGTHVNSASEIGKITIRKIKCKSGSTKVSYEIT